MPTPTDAERKIAEEIVADIPGWELTELNIEILRKDISKALASHREEQVRIDADIVSKEPEYPGDMPDEMWFAVCGYRDATTKAMQITVRLTKKNISEAILNQLKQERDK